MSVPIDLQNQVAIVTGASQGIGAETARRLHAAGAKVVLNHPDIGNSCHDAGLIAQQMNEQRADSAYVLAADVSDASQVEAMMQAAKQQLGGVNFLINNAGILRDRTIAKMSLDEWQSVIDVNLTGVFHCCKFALAVMHDGGAIVNLSSIAAIMGFYGQTNYAAAKGGVASMTKVLARECGRRRIRVNAIAPGVIDTAMAQQIPQTARDDMLKNIPLGRFGAPREIADTALFLCSPLASYISGQIVEVNGGWRG